MNKACCYLLIVMLLVSSVFIIDYLKIRRHFASSILADDQIASSPPQETDSTRLKDNTKSIESILKDFLETRVEYQTTTENEDDQNRFIPDISPLDCKIVISQLFSDLHPGIDLAAPAGTPVLATAAGKVQVARMDNYFGRLIILEHFNGYYSYYAHLQELYKKPSDFVEKGEIIGTVGSSGFSTGPHLHYSIQKDDEFIDPEPFLND
jgi:murein DD-endopeptidase MepM/ murein hydrolase activator NlpD